MNYENLVGMPIRSLQTMLRLISQNDDEVLPVIPDGIYGKDTITSVASFQKRHDLPVTGITDLQTWNAVSSAYRAFFVNCRPAEPVLPVLQQNLIIRAGERNDHLYMMHGMMRAIAAHFPSMPVPEDSNVHDADSVAAVQWLQTRAGIEPTGEITRLTWKNLAKLYRITVGDGTHIPWNAPRTDSGPDNPTKAEAADRRSGDNPQKEVYG